MWVQLLTEKIIGVRLMDYSGLFDFWAIVITAGIFFISVVSIFLYAKSPNTAQKKKGGLAAKMYRTGVDFIFVWVLLSLLVLYVVSIGRLSLILFALGNIAIEAALLTYLLKNASEETQRKAG